MAVPVDARHASIEERRISRRSNDDNRRLRPRAGQTECGRRLPRVEASEAQCSAELMRMPAPNRASATMSMLFEIKPAKFENSGVCQAIWEFGHGHKTLATTMAWHSRPTPQARRAGGKVWANRRNCLVDIGDFRQLPPENWRRVNPHANTARNDACDRFQRNGRCRKSGRHSEGGPSSNKIEE